MRVPARGACSHIGHDHVQTPREPHASAGDGRTPWALLHAFPLTQTDVIVDGELLSACPLALFARTRSDSDSPRPLPARVFVGRPCTRTQRRAACAASRSCVGLSCSPSPSQSYPIPQLKCPLPASPSLSRLPLRLPVPPDCCPPSCSAAPVRPFMQDSSQTKCVSAMLDACPITNARAKQLEWRSMTAPVRSAFDRYNHRARRRHYPRSQDFRRSFVIPSRTRGCTHDAAAPVTSPQYIRHRDRRRGRFRRPTVVSTPASFNGS